MFTKLYSMMLLPKQNGRLRHAQLKKRKKCLPLSWQAELAAFPLQNMAQEGEIGLPLLLLQSVRINAGVVREGTRRRCCGKCETTGCQPKVN